MPQRLIQETFKKHGKNSKISLELLHKKLRIYDKTDDSFPSKIFDTTTLDIHIVPNERFKAGLNFHISIAQDERQICAVDPSHVKSVVLYVHISMCESGEKFISIPKNAKYEEFF